MDTQEQKDLQAVLSKLTALEQEVSRLKSYEEKKQWSLVKSAGETLRKIFSRSNLEIFLSLASVAISTTVLLYLIFVN